MIPPCDNRWKWFSNKPVPIALTRTLASDRAQNTGVRLLRAPRWAIPMDLSGLLEQEKYAEAARRGRPGRSSGGRSRSPRDAR
jgi:hypothetical protein